MVLHFMRDYSFIELLKQKILLNICLLSKKEQDTSHKLYLSDVVFWLVSLIW